MKVIKEFNYSIRPGKMILPLLMFSACAALFFFKAFNNDRGLIINGIIKLNEGQGTVFYYVIAGLSCLFVMAAIAAIINGLRVKQKLIICSDGLDLPIGKETARLYFSNIASAQMLDIYKTRIIEFVTKDKKEYSILDSKLGTKAEFDEVYALISENIKNVKP
jgi:hypothetical protein